MIKHGASFDGGLTWVCTRRRLDAGFPFMVDPEVVFDTHGNVLLFYLSAFGPGGNSVCVRRSTDGGVTFGKSTVITLDPGDDKPKAAVCRAAVAHFGRIALTWMRGDAALVPEEILAAYSDDHGKTWSPPVTINEADSNGGRESLASDIAFASDGDLFVMWQDESPREVWCDRSADGGATFGTDVVVSPYVNPPNPLTGFQFDLKPVFALAVDATGGPHDGNVYVVHHT